MYNNIFQRTDKNIFLVSGYSDHTDHAAYPMMTAGTVSRERLTGASLSRDTSEDRKYLGMPLTPSDTSIDDSVKSGNLMKYLSHKPGPSYGRGVTSDSEHTSGPGEPGDNVEPMSPPPTLPGYHSLHSQPRSRPTSSYNPYFQPHSHAPSLSLASPRYSSPPPLFSHTGLASPLPRQAPYEDRGLYPPLEPPVSLTSISPTPGMFHPSASPSLDMFGGGGKSRPIMSQPHQHYGPIPSNVFQSIG